MSNRAFVTGLRVGEDVEVMLGNTEDKSLREVAEEVGLEWDGTTFIVNGRRLSETEAAAYVPKDGDRIEGGRDTKGGA